MNRDLKDSNLKRCISLNHQMLSGSSCFRKGQTLHSVIQHCQRFKMPNSTDPVSLKVAPPAPRHPSFKPLNSLSKQFSHIFCKTLVTTPVNCFRKSSEE